MVDKNAVTLITQSSNLTALPFRPTGNCWEAWLEPFEKEIKYFRINNLVYKNMH